MTLVTTILTTTEICDKDVDIFVKVICDMTGYEVKHYKYKYSDRRYFELDIDLLNVNMTKKTFHTEIKKLIFAYEHILSITEINMEIIAANDDTEVQIAKYENDNNDVNNCGLFISRRSIPSLIPYYTSNICNAYLNTKHVSFGVFF